MSTRPFYAVKMRSGMVMVFEWSTTEIAEAMLHRGILGVINCIEAEGSIPAEEEAKRLFAAGQFNPTVIGKMEASK